MDNIYNSSFYENQKGGSYNSGKIILPLVMEYLEKVGSVLDVGCGVGTWLAVCKELGASNVTGVDGAYVDRSQLFISQDEFSEHDLREPLDLKRRFDLVISVEVAEHIPAERAEVFVNSLCVHGDVVLFSAAIPGQGGTHHINEQYPSYWTELFLQNDYLCLDIIRPTIWRNPDVMWWYSQNILLFIKEGSKAFEEILPKVFHNFLPLDAVHPVLFQTYYKR